MTSAHDPRHAQGGGYPPPPGGGGYGPPPGGYGPPGPGGYGPPGYGPPGAPGGYGPPGAPGGYGPPGPPYAAPPPGYPAGYGPGAPPPPVPAVKKQAQTWLIIGGVSFMTCGCLFGVIGIVFCYMAMQAADAGNWADAENKLKWGKITTLVGFGIGVVLSVVGLINLSALMGTLLASMSAGSP